PLLRPILVTLAAFSFLATWNDFLWPLIVLSDERKFTLPVALASLVGEHVQDTELMMAGSVVTVIPVLVLFLALQRSYIRGVLMGGVRGGALAVRGSSGPGGWWAAPPPRSRGRPRPSASMSSRTCRPGARIPPTASR